MPDDPPDGSDGCARCFDGIDHQGYILVKILRFPWSLTKISKLPLSQIDRIAEDFLNQKFHGKSCSGATDQIGRKNILDKYRLIVRLLTEMQLRGIVALGRLFEQDYLAGNAFVALLSQTGRIQPDFLVAETCGAGRPITIRAMARSFHRPYETMRRALRRLAALDLVDLRDDGAVLRRDALHQPGVRPCLDDMHDSMVTLMEDLFVFAKLPLPNSVAGHHRQRLITLAALDLHLLAVEGMQGIFSDWTGLLVVSAIITGNVRNITYHPELAFTYAAVDQLPPMRLRKPVQFKALCDALSICPTTAWRRITVMKMLGSAKTIEGGLVIDGGWLNNAALIANGCDRIERMNHIINRMASSGVPLDNIASLYLNGRVAPVNL